MKNAVTATNVCTQSADWWSHQPTMESRHLASMPIFASLGLEGCWSWYRPFCLETLHPPSVNSTCWLFVASSGKEKQKTWQNAVNSTQLTFGSNVKNFQKTKCWWRFFENLTKNFWQDLNFHISLLGKLRSRLHPCNQHRTDPAFAHDRRWVLAGQWTDATVISSEQRCSTCP